MITWSQESLPECNLQGCSNFKLSHEKKEDSITIRINRNLQTIDNKLEKSLENEDEIESCSAVVELEPNELKANSFALSEPVQDLTFFQTNETSMPDSCPTNSPSELHCHRILEKKLTRFPFLMKQLAEKVHHSNSF